MNSTRHGIVRLVRGISVLLALFLTSSSAAFTGTGGGHGGYGGGNGGYGGGHHGNQNYYFFGNWGWSDSLDNYSSPFGVYPAFGGYGASFGAFNAPAYSRRRLSDRKRRPVICGFPTVGNGRMLEAYFCLVKRRIVLA